MIFGPEHSADARWTSWHLHLSTLGTRASDDVIRHAVGPAVDALSTGWFFVRYWQFGPHVRLRVANLTPDDESRLEALLQSSVAGLAVTAGAPLTAEQYLQAAAPLAAAGEGGRELDTGELWPAGVYRQRYQPEVARYGGAALIAESEALFQRSSELALAFLRLDPPESARSGLGLRATQAALAVVGGEEERRRLCQRAAAGWQAWADRAGVGKLPAASYQAPTEVRDPPAPVTRWAGQLGRSMTTWRAEVGEEMAERILQSHIHMLHNRLGLNVAQEQIHYRALAEVA